MTRKGRKDAKQAKKLMVSILEELMQEDYERYCHEGYSHLVEHQWRWLIRAVKDKETKNAL